MSNHNLSPKALAFLAADAHDRMAAIDTLVSEAQEIHQRVVLMTAELRRNLRTLAFHMRVEDPAHTDEHHVGPLAHMLQEPQR
ncbi:hypothetical protein [Pseudomonas putida]|uniref:hypothetical protein n=1 Tax=Pseudomonas putida TaxID=303 RepID=UPI0015F9BF6A|nr:hypothetical protein [Pseudomonas putida]